MHNSVLSAALLLLLASDFAAGQVFDTYTGRELFEQFCASCHGAEGTGDGPVARGLSAEMPDLTRLSEDNGGEFPEQYLRTVIDGRYVVSAHGARYMPVWGYEFWVAQGADDEAHLLAEVMMENLVGYIELIQLGRPDGQP